MPTIDKLPSNFAFRRSFVIADAAMYNYFKSEDRETPLTVVEHGIRGTQNVADNTAKAEGERDVSNIQTTQTAKTHNDADGFIARFGLRLNDINHALESCAGLKAEETRTSLDAFIAKSLKSNAPELISQRFARNIVNGRWLWRNRVTASTIQIECSHDDNSIASINSFDVPMHHFDKPTKAEKAVAKVLEAGMRGDRTSNLDVAAEVSFGINGSVEVFASQNYVSNKPTGFARPLYKLIGEVDRQKPTEDGFYVVGQAAIRDQKISNAIKTVDTWYPGFEDFQHIIPIEPNGANLDTMNFHRPANGAASAFNIFRRLDDIDPVSDDGLYALAIIIRGGVLSVSDKNKGAK